jgi:hypothetical protein
MVMARIILNDITWDTPPDSAKQVTIQYKLKAAPDVPASYIIIATGVFVGADGLFPQPFVISGLDMNKAYTVKVISVCGGYSATKDFEYDNTVAGFSLGFSIGFNS